MSLFIKNPKGTKFGTNLPYKDSTLTKIVERGEDNSCKIVYHSLLTLSIVLLDAEKITVMNASCLTFCTSKNEIKKGNFIFYYVI